MIFLVSFWNLVGFAGLDELYNGYLFGKSNNGSDPSSPGVGSSAQGGSNPGDPTPPNGQDPLSGIAGAGHTASQSEPDSKHTIGWDLGSAADSDDFVHRDEIDTIHVGVEKEGFMSRNA